MTIAPRFAKANAVSLQRPSGAMCRHDMQNVHFAYGNSELKGNFDPYLPMPLVAPVTNAVLPVRSRLMVL